MEGPKRISWAEGCWSWPVKGAIKILTVAIEIGHSRSILPLEKFPEATVEGKAGFPNSQRTSTGTESLYEAAGCGTGLSGGQDKTRCRLSHLLGLLDEILPNDQNRSSCLPRPPESQDHLVSMGLSKRCLADVVPSPHPTHSLGNTWLKSTWRARWTGSLCRCRSGRWSLSM